MSDSAVYRRTSPGDIFNSGQDKDGVVTPINICATVGVVAAQVVLPAVTGKKYRILSMFISAAAGANITFLSGGVNAWRMTNAAAINNYPFDYNEAGWINSHNVNEAITITTVGTGCDYTLVYILYTP